MKKYVNDLNELNEEERRTGKISYKRLIERIANGIFLFNEAPKLSEYDFEFICGNDYDKENDEYIEIYQYYLIDLCITEEQLNNEFKELQKELIIAWSETLQNYVLMVDHCGTSWNYVMTDIGYTTNYEEADF